MLNHLDVFATVVEQKSLNKAAQSMNISQPALSRKIGQLEDELGVLLFDRKGKRLELTRIGHICYETALDMRKLEEKLLHTIAKYHTSGISSIKIGASLTTLQSTLPDLIALYTKDYPETDIKALTGKTHEIVSMVKDKKVDLGLVASRIDHSELNCVPLFDDHLSLVLPTGHTWCSRESIDIDDLQQLPMILFSKGTWYRILMDELFQRYSVSPDVKMEIDSFEAIIRLVSTCNVATLLPKSYLRQTLLDNNGLVLRDVKELRDTVRTTSLIFSESAALNASTLMWIDKAKRYYASPSNL
ncbi:MAG: LysR family transcriptional regulator [Paenibacillus sp.]|jgi:DNA-binding transcriptional LysR family regulator|nr:LysR family transcriptional regulator [Paenibacillus sp.]